MKANIPHKSRKDREITEAARQSVKRTLEYAVLIAVLVLGENGYGKKRIGKFANRFMELSEYFVDNYGSDCAMFALRKKAKELYDIEVQI